MAYPFSTPLEDVGKQTWGALQLGGKRILNCAGPSASLAYPNSCLASKDGTFDVLIMAQIRLDGLPQKLLVADPLLSDRHVERQEICFGQVEHRGRECRRGPIHG